MTHSDYEPKAVSTRKTSSKASMAYGLAVGLLTVASACSGESGDAQNSVASTTSPAATSTSPAAPPPESTFDSVTLDGGAKLEVEWWAEPFFVVQNPDAEISTNCPVSDLPEPQATFYVISVTLTNPSSRPLTIWDTLIRSDTGDSRLLFDDPTYPRFHDDSECTPKDWGEVPVGYRFVGEGYETISGEWRYSEFVLDGGESVELLAIFEASSNSKPDTVFLQVGEDYELKKKLILLKVPEDKCATKNAEMLGVMDELFDQMQAGSVSVELIDSFSDLSLTFPDDCDTTDLILYLKKERVSTDPNRSALAKELMPDSCEIWKDRGNATARAACP